MEQIRRILERVTRERQEGVVYNDVFEEVMTLFQSRLVQLSGLREDEVAILLMDSRRNLKFYRPKYLERSGLIPASYTRSFVTSTIQSGRPAMNNHFNSTQHLAMFEELKRNNPNAEPIQKMLCIPLRTSDGLVFGAIEFGKKGASLEEAGTDWSSVQMESLSETVNGVADYFYQLCLMARILA
jgi:hypothetical protein